MAPPPLEGRTPGNVLTVQGPQEVTLVNLDLIGRGAASGGGAGLSVNGTATVMTYGVVAEHNGSAGFSVGAGAALSMYGGGAFDNGWYGINLGLDGSASLRGRALLLGGREPLVVSGNTGGGIRVDRGHLYASTGYTIEDNLGPGLTAYAGVAALADYQASSESFVQGNQGGVFASEGSRITFVGSVALLNNGSYGVYVEDGGNASFIAQNPASGESKTVVVEGHTTVGVEVVAHSQASFHGHHVIRANGKGAPPGVVGAGIWVDGTSHAYIDDNGGRSTPPEVVENHYGVLVTLNSSIDARAGIVRDNLAAGIAILSQSIAYLGPDPRLLGPAGGTPLTCDSTSLVSTNLVRRSGSCINVIGPVARPLRPEMPK